MSRRRGPGVLLLGPVLASLGGCTLVTWQAADLQIDVDAALPPGTTRVHICVEDVGEHTEGAANGRFAVPAIPFADRVTVTVEAWTDDEDPDAALLAATAPTEMSLDVPYLVVPLGAAETSCTSEDAFAPKGSASWLLGVRFLGEESVGSPE